MFFQKYNPRAKYFDHLIDLLREAGITDYLMRQLLPYGDMKDIEVYWEEKLVLEHFYIPFCIIVVGLLIGCFAFIGELIYCTVYFYLDNTWY